MRKTAKYCQIGFNQDYLKLYNTGLNFNTLTVLPTEIHLGPEKRIDMEEVRPQRPDFGGRGGREGGRGFGPPPEGRDGGRGREGDRGRGDRGGRDGGDRGGRDGGDAPRRPPIEE